MNCSVQSVLINKVFCRYCKRTFLPEGLNHDNQVCLECVEILKSSVPLQNVNSLSEFITENQSYIILKTIILGDLESNKTQLFNNYINNYLNNSYQQTIGLDISGKDFYIDDRYIRITISIISHLNRFKIIRREFYSGANLAFLVFNSTSEQSISEVEHTWNAEILDYKQRTNNKTDIIKILIGNSWDLESERLINEEEVESLSKKMDCVGYYLCNSFGEVISANMNGLNNNLHDTFLNTVKYYFENVYLQER